LVFEKIYSFTTASETAYFVHDTITKNYLQKSKRLNSAFIQSLTTRINRMIHRNLLSSKFKLRSRSRNQS